MVGQSDAPGEPLRDRAIVLEQNIVLSADDGQLLKARRVKVCLEQPNRDGDKEIFILTNLPSEVAPSLLIAQLYRKRWKLETLFQALTENLRCEISQNVMESGRVWPQGFIAGKKAEFGTKS